MNKQRWKLFAALISVLLVTASAVQAENSATLKGTVTDTDGNPIQMAIVYLNSPELPSVPYYITGRAGRFRFSSLPGGQYRLLIEVPGYKKVIIPDILIRPGMTRNLHIRNEATSIEGEELVLDLSTAMLDLGFPSNLIVIENEILSRIPFQRDFSKILGSIPGFFAEDIAYPEAYIVQGAPAYRSDFSLEGLQTTAPSGGELITSGSLDAIEEVTIETSGHSVVSGSPGGGFVTILTKTGNKGFDFSLLGHHTASSLNGKLWSESQLSNWGVSSPVHMRSQWDTAMTLGGSLFPGRAWLFSSARMNLMKNTTPFLPWTDPQGIEHSEYEQENNIFDVYVKLTTIPYTQFRLSAIFHMKDDFRSEVAPRLDFNLVSDAAQKLDHERTFMYFGNADYALSQAPMFISAEDSFSTAHLFSFKKTGEASPFSLIPSADINGGAPGRMKNTTKSVFICGERLPNSSILSRDWRSS